MFRIAFSGVHHSLTRRLTALHTHRLYFCVVALYLVSLFGLLALSWATQAATVDTAYNAPQHSDTTQTSKRDSVTQAL